MIDKLRKRLSLWQGRHLSMGGRVTLINSVLNSIPLYYLSFYKAPKVVIKSLIKIQRNFLWGINEVDRGMYWVAWDKICKPKEEGGLGVKNIELFNVALLAKWKWRILSEEDAPWWDLLSHRYGDLKSIFFSENRPLNRRANYSLW